jgi:hypothetical protein
MSSAKIFRNSQKNTAKGAVFAKYDIKDAYKLIPSYPDQWHYLEFKWLGRYLYL